MRVESAKNFTQVEKTWVEFAIYQPYYAFELLAVFKLSKNSCSFKKYYKFL